MIGKKIVAGAAGLLFTGTLVISPVLAQDSPQDQIDQARENQQKFQEQRQETVQARCELVETRVSNWISRYDEGKIRRINRYNNLIERLNNLVNYLNERDIDTQDLPNQINDLDSLISDFELQMDEVIEALRLTQDYACGESEGDYREQLVEARQERLEARATAIDINQYFLDTIVPELQEIRSKVDAS